MRRANWSVLFILATTLPSHIAVAEPAYRDDRSDPQALIQSLYNAINRHEYARAWDYFSVPPAAKFAAYSDGFESTARVEVLTGPAKSDGAVGSIFYDVPVAVHSIDLKNQERYFAGCYTLRQVIGTVQEPPNQPLRIEKGSLKLSQESSLLAALPPSCGEGQAGDPDETILTDVKKRFIAEHQGQCDHTVGVDSGEKSPETYQLSYKDEGAGDAEPLRKSTLFAFACSMAAYNSSEVYYLHDDIFGLRELNFAQPEFSFKYADDESKVLTSWAVKGYSAARYLVNSSFDEKTASLSSFAKGRGLADASSSGTWFFDRGEFILKTYDVDPTYNEEMDPIAVIIDGKVQNPAP